MKVLQATDGSAQATTALGTAASLLRCEGAKFDLLRVAPDFYLPRGKAPKRPQKASRMVEAYRRQIKLKARGHLLHSAVRRGTAQSLTGTSPKRALTRICHVERAREESTLAPTPSHN